jgi:hypothetical protein
VLPTTKNNAPTLSTAMRSAPDSKLLPNNSARVAVNQSGTDLCLDILQCSDGRIEDLRGRVPLYALQVRIIRFLVVLEGDRAYNMNNSNFIIA